MDPPSCEPDATDSYLTINVGGTASELTRVDFLMVMESFDADIRDALELVRQAKPHNAEVLKSGGIDAQYLCRIRHGMSAIVAAQEEIGRFRRSISCSRRSDETGIYKRIDTTINNMDIVGQALLNAYEGITSAFAVHRKNKT